jgi:hypothetical protein
MPLTCGDAIEINGIASDLRYSLEISTIRMLGNPEFRKHVAPSKRAKNASDMRF